MIETSSSGRGAIAVFVHVHYLDIWQELSAVIAERLDVPFRLIVTTSHPDVTIDPPDTPCLVSMDVVLVENRGRDILPFMRALARTHDFDIGLKLHTKKSLQRSDGAAWRAALYSQLMPAEGGTTRLVSAMSADTRIGFVAPDGFSLSVKPWVFGNMPSMASVMKTLGHELVSDNLDDAFFAAGSMFWFRRAALSEFANDHLPGLFEPEEGQLDGTVAHAVERLFAVEVRRQGFISIARSGLLASQPTDPASALVALARKNADIPNVYFPAAGIAAGADTAPEASRPDRKASLWRTVAKACPPRLKIVLRRLMAV